MTQLALASYDITGAQLAESPLPARSDPARLLAVDDTRSVRDVIARVLRGYRVDCAADGQEALGRLRQNGYDLLITDLFMPGLPGIDLVQAVQAQWPALPVIVASVNPIEGIAASRVNPTTTSYLMKPFGPASLRTAVEAALRRDGSPL